MPLLPLFLLVFAGSVARSGAEAAGPPHPGAEALAAETAGVAGDPSTSVRDALRKRNYPWYDARADRLRPMIPARWSWLKRLGDWFSRVLEGIGKFFDRFNLKPIPGMGSVGNSLATVLLISVLAAFLAALLVLWLRGGWRGRFGPTDAERLGTVARLAQLPEGIRPGGEDPWAEAIRRRAAGDLAGAIVCVFAHQLLALDEDGLIRLVPGRTGRQYVQGLRDPELHEMLGGTLGLFEEVYYGHRLPPVRLFEKVWSGAEAFRDRRSLPGGAR